MTARSRDLDVVVHGATGFVGKLVARYLAEHAPAGTRIGLSGRSLERLEKVRAGLGPTAADWPLLRADATDDASLRALAAAAHVVATTVGPYAKYGLPLVRACAEAGTDYVDLTGEVPFARESIDLFHETAAASGARIVHSCGFDSIPSDLGVHVLHRQVRADGAGDLTDTTLVVTSLRGGVSGGTIDSLRTQIDETKHDAALRRLTASPYSLSPDRAAEPDLGPQSDVALVRGSDIAPGLSGWKAPFFMGPYNTRVVRRSNALTGHTYGKQFRYREVMNVGSSFASPVIAAGVAAGMGGLVAGLAFPPTRWVLDRVLPKPGQGPSEKSQRHGHFTIDVFGRTTTGARYTARVAAQGDPGYAATAVMFGESALALALQRDDLPGRAGVLTPAIAMGDVLADRLRAAGFEIRAGRA
ncbi:enoyl-ACP reductase [Prescottella agglutinans]|uniref:Enoyl-ACP reductase n=1 Tax=Prescottella agglutinans TaxID=1644129 RepID=A0A3S3E9H9_9NOCA|nr:saccharopine dehydrogenase NADP-binding domain-containing protein [Prescottella agglutinans]RVW08847.1 enoyl-ACP reductase [Prescottella agglutinans]